MLQEQANDAGCRDKRGFGNALHGDNDSERDSADQDRRHVDESTPTEYDHRPSDRTGGGRRDAVDECLDARARGKAAKMWCRKHGHEIHRREHADRCDGGPDWPRNEIPDERDGDHDRSRRDHRNGDRIEELPSVSQWNCSTTPPWRKGTIASPLPNTN